MSSGKGIYYELYYKSLYNCILNNPNEFTCLIQEYNSIIKELEKNSYDDFDFIKEKEFINDLYHNVLNDAYENGVIDKAEYELWKRITDDDPFPPLSD